MLVDKAFECQGQRTYTVMIPVPPEKPTLGLTLQLAPLSVTQNIWHVLSIPSPLSPAYLAGLLPHSDYILGTPSGTLRGEAALGELVEDHLNRSLTLWVYNSEFDVVREVELVPNRNWGGEGALGAVLGFGALHRLPVGLGEEVEGPGEVVFDMKGGEKNMNQPSSIPPPGGNFIVPAEMASPLPPPPKVNGQAPPQVAPPPGRHGRKHRHAHAAPVSLDDYFRESEQKSREQDFVPSQTGSPVPPPPPPKASELASAASKSPEGITSPAE